MIRTYGAKISVWWCIYPVIQQIVVGHKIQSQEQELHIWSIWLKLPISKWKNYIWLCNFAIDSSLKPSNGWFWYASWHWCCINSHINHDSNALCWKIMPQKNKWVLGCCYDYYVGMCCNCISGTNSIMCARNKRKSCHSADERINRKDMENINTV